MLTLLKRWMCALFPRSCELCASDATHHRDGHDVCEDCAANLDKLPASERGAYCAEKRQERADDQAW